jgi:hypothetical protein
VTSRNVYECTFEVDPFLTYSAGSIIEPGEKLLQYRVLFEISVV